MRLVNKAIEVKPGYALLPRKAWPPLENCQCIEQALAITEESLCLELKNLRKSRDLRRSLPEGIEFIAGLDSIYESYILLYNTYSRAFLKIGDALYLFKCFAEAVSSYDAAIKLEPNCAEAFINRGHALRKLHRFEEALASFDRALALQPNNAIALANRGVVLSKLNRLSEAVASYDRAIALRPDLIDALYNRSFALLMIGSFERGWQEYEWRKLKRSDVRSYPKPIWTGVEELKGKTILVHSEQGLGDTIQFCRYIKLLERLDAEVMFLPQTVLQTLMKGLSSAVRIIKNIENDDRALDFDYHCPLMSLPFAFKTSLENVPADIPYLAAQPDRVNKWKKIIGGDGFKIGICWQGSTNPIDEGRSFSLGEFFNLSQFAGVRLISLHKGAGEDQLADLPSEMSVETLGAEFDAGPDAFLDAAAVMQCCDLVITSDNAIAHLAGALGRPTWVPLKYTPDWRWLLDRADSPWYPTMRLFRQKTSEDWRGVFQEIQSALVEEMEARWRAASDMEPC